MNPEQLLVWTALAGGLIAFVATLVIAFVSLLDWWRNR